MKPALLLLEIALSLEAIGVAVADVRQPLALLLPVCLESLGIPLPYLDPTFGAAALTANHTLIARLTLQLPALGSLSASLTFKPLVTILALEPLRTSLTLNPLSTSTTLYLPTKILTLDPLHTSLTLKRFPAALGDPFRIAGAGLDRGDALRTDLLASLGPLGREALSNLLRTSILA